MIFESHAHYDDEAFDIDREELLKELPEKGIKTVINVCSDYNSLEKTRKIVEAYSYIYGAFGIHPSETEELNTEKFDKLREYCKLEKCVAIGEIGLDYYWKEPEVSIQKEWFIKQLKLSKECNLPIIVHSRDACQDTIEILKTEHAASTGGVIHCYSYSKESAREFLDMGYHFGFGGVVTFQNAKKVREALKAIPMERILIETDSPYLAPVPNRGKRNSSLNLPYIIEMIANVKEITKEEVEKITEENAKRLFLMK